MNFCTYLFIFFFFNDTATTEIYTLSLHDALPISDEIDPKQAILKRRLLNFDMIGEPEASKLSKRSEEHTSELQSPDHLVCRLLLEKKKKDHHTTAHPLERLPTDTAIVAIVPPRLH